MMQNKPVWTEKPATEILHSTPIIQNQLHDPEYAVCSNTCMREAPVPQMAKQMPTEV